MKKSFNFLLGLTLTAGIFVHTANAQITVSGSNTKDGSYTSLTKANGAFAALNSITQLGKTIVITITADVTNEDGVTWLTGDLGMWTSIAINPSGTRTISGSVVGSGVLCLWKGDYVTIDGLNTGGNSLTISNTSTANSAYTSTLRFVGDATHNTVQNCTITGSSTTTTGGIVFFDTGWTNGNDFNLIDKNNITNAGGNRPLYAIYSSGTSATNNNSDNTISNNRIYDFFNPLINHSAGIFLYNHTSDCNVTGNTFYETTSFGPTGGAFNLYVIRIENKTSGNNFKVTGNYIGGNAADHSGKFTVTSTTGHIFFGIRLSVFTTTPSSVQDNTIQNIDYTSSSGTPFYGIFALDVGSINIGTVTGNTIGSNTGTGSITLTNPTANAFSYGIWNTGSGILDIENNQVGAITTVGSATIAHSFYSIRSDAGTNTISNNTIGSATTSNSIHASSTSSNGQSVYGITATSTGTTTISGNTVANLTNASTATSGEISGILSSGGTRTISNNTVRDLTIANSNTESVSGINFSCNIAAAQTITGNTIYNLSNTHPSFAGKLTGLYYQGPVTASTVSGNFIHSLSVTGASSTGASIYGIRIGQGSATYSNNIISLGGNTKTIIYGIYETGVASTNNNLYFNTVYIGGTPASGSTNKSYALYSAVNTNTRDFRNNIFSNVCSTSGGASLHYAAWLNYLVSTNLTLDYNDYYAPGIGSVLGRYAGADVLTLPVITGLDANSSPANPNFVTPGGTTAANYLPQSLALVAATGTGINTDFDGGAARSETKPAMGAYEYTVSGELVTVTASAGTGSAVYTRLKAAFDAIDAGTHKGDISIAINSSITETASAVLHQTGYNGTSDYSTVHVYPTVTGLTINGNLPAPLIDLDGTDHVTIDGRVGGTGSTKDLIISNLSTFSTVGTSTIRFINDACTNTVQYCTIKGSSLATTGGILFFSTTTGTTGNDGNQIDNNNITNSADANRPLNAIYSLGITGSNLENSGNIISNNNIYDFLNKATASNGINLGTFTTAWTISGNSFYETATFVPTATKELYPIYIISSGTNFSIYNNYIGGSSAQCGGTAWTKTNTSDNGFRAMNISVGTGVASSIQGNTIKNMSWSNSGNSIWCGIFINTGDVNIGTTSGNVIGAADGNGSIKFTGGGSSSVSYGIRNAGTGTVDIQNNTIGSITTNNSNFTYPSAFYAISKGTGAGTTTISNNQIGSTVTAASINVSSLSTATAQKVMGIQNNGTGTITISGNTVANMSNANTFNGSGAIDGIYSDAGTNTITNNTVRDLTIANLSNSEYNTAAVIGISLSSVSNATTITGNTIYNLSNTNAAYAGYIYGLYYFGSTTASTVSKNFIHSLSVTGASSTSASIYGIKIYGGATTYSNNIISLGGSTPTTLYGIWENGASSTTNSLYFNTVYIGGVPTSGALNSYALYSAVTTNTRNFRNNIFDNERSNGGTPAATGKHYAAYFATNPSATGLTEDYNDYLASGTGGTFGYFNGADKTSLADWKTATGKDANSLNTDPLFASAGGTTAASYIPAAALTGIAASGIPTTDYSGTTRAAIPTMGAYDVSNIWTGTAGTDWNTTGNWSANTVPTSSSNVAIPHVTNDPIVSQLPATPAICNNLSIATGAVLTIAPGKALTVSGTLANSSGTSGLVIQSTSAGTGSLINSTAGVPASAERYIARWTDANHGWHFLSSPVANQAISASFVDITGTISTNLDLYKWSESQNLWINIKNDAGTYNQGTGTTNWSNDANPVFETGKGYMTAYSTNLTKTFIGTLNVADVPITGLTNTTGKTNRGWHLVGNPFSSAIKWTQGSSWAKTNIGAFPQI